LLGQTATAEEVEEAEKEIEKIEEIGEQIESSKKPDGALEAKIQEKLRKIQKGDAPTTFVEGHAFQAFGACLIISNALVIGMETDIEWEHWHAIEHAFLLAFTIELGTRICVIGPLHFIWSHADVHWNLFDLFIVGIGIVDTANVMITGNAGSGSFATIFRMIRLLRILRMLRMLKFLKHLYVLAFGLVEACKAVFWVTILMLFVLYVCSIVLVKTIGRPPKSHPYHDFLNYRFGHIFDAMLTLFILMSSADLPDYENTDGLLQHNPPLTIFLCMFVVFGSFGIVALLTGVISESMFEKNEVRKEEVRAEHEEMRKVLGEQCESLFRELPGMAGNESGEANIEAVKTLVPQMWELLDMCGAEMTHGDVLKIIEFMDCNGTGLIDCKEFREAVEKIAEGLSPLGIQEVASKIGTVEAKVDKLSEDVEALQVNMGAIRQQGLEMSQALQSILEHLGSAPVPGSKQVISQMPSDPIVTGGTGQSPLVETTGDEPSPVDAGLSRSMPATALGGEKLSPQPQNQAKSLPGPWDRPDPASYPPDAASYPMPPMGSFAFAAEAAARRLGLATPDRSGGQQTNAWPLQIERGTKPASLGDAGTVFIDDDRLPQLDRWNGGTGPQTYSKLE